MAILNDVIADYDNEISRLQLRREITRSRKRQIMLDFEYRKDCKEKLINGIYTPWECLASTTTSRSLINSITFDDASTISISNITDESDEEERQESPGRNLCVVCLTEREFTWLFLPCKHANCCTQCSNIITETALTCPTCRAAIVDKIQVFLNSLLNQSSAARIFQYFSFQQLSSLLSIQFHFTFLIKLHRYFHYNFII